MPTTLLVGTDGSEDGTRALDFAADRAQCSGENLIIAYVIEWSPYSFNTPQENAERHKRREEEIERAQTEVINPLNDLAEEYGALMIFVGRQGNSKLKSVLFGSVAGALVQIATVPVTVVP